MKRILLIEDDEQVRKMMTQVLERAQYEVLEAPNGKIGCDLFREKSADLIITDIFMPEKSGLDTISSLHKEFPELKIIAISGGARGGSFDFLPVAKSLGAKKILKKPFNREELLTAISAIFSDTKP